MEAVKKDDFTLFALVRAVDEITRLKIEVKTIRNELCYYCGKYRKAHLGACDDCRWKDKAYV